MILIFKFNIILKCQGFESHHLHNGGGGGGGVQMEKNGE